MSTRNELAADISRSAREIDERFDIGHESTELADKLLAAGWSKPRTLDSVDELEALPVSVVLRNNKSGRVFEKARRKSTGKSEWMRMQDRWVYETYEILYEGTWTVLFIPEVKA